MKKKKGKQLISGQVVIPVGHPNPPEPHEIDVAMLLARHYKTTVEFLIPIDDYKRKTADMITLGVAWEIKCPKGSSKYTIQSQFRRASKQAKNIIIDTRRTKLDYESIEKQVLFEVKNRPAIKKLIILDKFERVIEIKK